MKRSLMLLASILLCAGLAKATESTASAGLDPSLVDTLNLTLPDGGDKTMSSLDVQSPDDQMKAQAYCNAWTTCPSGRRISCYSRGEYCRWAYRAGQWVYCSATSYGRTRWVRYTCY
jgi:hypothetical protein